MIHILTIGDIVGAATLEVLAAKLRARARALGADFIIANGENVTGIHGLGAKDAQALWDAGVDVITLGNHTYGMRDIYTLLDDRPDAIIRPLNYPPAAPGCGYTICDIKGWRLLCMNVNGTAFMEPLSSPFGAVEQVLKRETGRYDVSILDIHAEATAEKYAIARAFDGRVSAMFGTHTHVATADEQILPGGSGYITDIGMSGPDNGILGTKTEAVLTKMRDKLPAHFTVADGPVSIRGALFTLDPSVGRCVDVRRVVF
ncbi:MAG: YmdB family metallophosphoesterase [Clostridia bacterium]|nr:YmdB family metallophosphoesterase [Clostridia bacterium]